MPVVQIHIQAIAGAALAALRRTAVAVVAAAALFPPATRAAGGAPGGPAAVAYQQWFASDRQLGCMDRNGGAVACSLANEPYVTILYGNADGGAGTQDAVALLTYLPDPTGNAQANAAAAFHREGEGAYRFTRRLADAPGAMMTPGTQARWGGGKIAMTMVFLQPTDSHCCPTGHKLVTLQVR